MLMSIDMFIERSSSQSARIGMRVHPGNNFRPNRGSGLAPNQNPKVLEAHACFTRNLYNANVLYRHGLNERLDRNNGGDIIVNVDRRKSWRRQGKRTKTLFTVFQIPTQKRF